MCNNIDIIELHEPEDIFPVLFSADQNEDVEPYLGDYRIPPKNPWLWSDCSITEILEWVKVPKDPLTESDTEYFKEVGAIIDIPFDQRLGKELKIPKRQCVYELTGIITVDGKEFPYLYIERLDNGDEEDVSLGVTSDVTPSRISEGVTKVFKESKSMGIQESPHTNSSLPQPASQVTARQTSESQTWHAINHMTKQIVQLKAR
jgi:hypothetical protein